MRATMRAMARFRRGEEGSVTIWNLMWFTGFCALLGMGMDTTTAHATKAQLQNTADAAAHAAIIDLLDPLDQIPLADRMATATAAAQAYGATNMPFSFFGTVVIENDVTFGIWEDGAFTPYTGPTGADTVGQGDEGEPNAVRVVSRRTAGRGNSVATSFLRVVGLYNWDIDAVSIVAADIDGVNDCREQGVIAGDLLDVTSNATFINDICLHGQQTFKIQQNHLIECGVLMSVNGLANIQGPWAGTVPIDDETCGGFAGQAANMDTMFPYALEDNDIPSMAAAEFQNARDILFDYADYLIHGAVAPADPLGVVPSWIERGVELTVQQFNNLEPYLPGTEYDSTTMYETGTLYLVECSGNQTLELKGIIRDIALATTCKIDFAKENLNSGQKDSEPTGDKKCNKNDTDCLDPEEPEIGEGDATYVATDGNTYGIEPGASVVLDNVVIVSTATGQNSVRFSEAAQVGRKDGCVAGGGVRMYIAGDTHFPADPVWYGAQLIAEGDVKFAAKADGAWGVNIEAGGDITFAAQGQAGACDFTGDDSDAVFGLRDYRIGVVR